MGRERERSTSQSLEVLDSFNQSQVLQDAQMCILRYTHVHVHAHTRTQTKHKTSWLTFGGFVG